MFCQHQTYANFARVDQFSTINKIAINTHDPCHNTIVRSQKVNFSADLAFAKVFYGYWLCTNGFVSTSMYMDLIPPPHTPTLFQVEEVFTLPLHHLANPRHQGYTEFRMRGRSLTSYHSPAFRGGPHRIWGFTGFILDMVLLRLAPTAVKYSPIVSRTLTTTIARTFKH